MLLQATQITKRFGHRTILSGVDIDLQPGEVVSIFGPNGAGKTTFIKILATLVKPTSGGLQIGGVDAFAHLQQVRRKLGVVIHEPLAYLDLSPYDNLKFFGRLYGVNDLERRIVDLLADVGLTPFAHEPIKIFSRGMTQRFMIAKALLHDPPILLFDEPFSGLDVAAKGFMLKLIGQECARGKGVILTTHDTELGYHAGSRFLFLLNGQIEAIGNKDEIELEALSRRYEERLKGSGL
jgi:heme exporter protein A